MFGRHVASDRLVSGAYRSEYGEASELHAVLEKVKVSMVSLIFVMFALSKWLVFMMHGSKIVL